MLKNFSSSFILCALLLVGITGCSKSGSGSKDGLGLDGGLSESELNAQRDRRFGEGGIPTAEGEGLFRDIQFDYDSSIVTDVGRQNVEYNASILRQRSSLKVQLEGHTDERGTAEYNLSLGQARAKAVQELLESYGISASSIETISYGEELPLEDGHDESSYAKNRRVHFSAFTGSGSGRSSKPSTRMNSASNSYNNSANSSSEDAVEGSNRGY